MTGAWGFWWRALVQLACWHSVRGWQLQHIDNTCAKTTIRLWHELHTVKCIPHDFCNMIAPQACAMGMYIGVVRHDEIRAIASCEHVVEESAVGRGSQRVRINAIAHAPQQPDAAIALLKLLCDRGAETDMDALRAQPRWYCELLFHLP